MEVEGGGGCSQLRLMGEGGKGGSTGEGVRSDGSLTYHSPRAVTQKGGRRGRVGSNVPTCSAPTNHNHHHRACGSHPEWHQVPNGWQIRAVEPRPAAENQRVRIDSPMQPRSPSFPPVECSLDASESQPLAHSSQLLPC